MSDLDVNTITYNLLTGEINDPLRAIEAIDSKRIGLVSERSLFLNPATIFKCLKISYKTGFDIAPESLELIRKNAGLVGRLKGWFLEKSLNEVLEYTAPKELLASLTDLGVVDVYPEIAGYLIARGDE